MQPPRFQRGGSFAPPITAEKLAEYRELAEKEARGAVRVHMQNLCDMVEKYLSLEDPSKGQEAQNLGTFSSGNGKSFQVMGRNLSKQAIAELDELVPWGTEEAGDHLNEVSHLSALFGSIQQDRAARNSHRLDSWRSAVKQHVFREMFPDQSIEFLALPAAYRATEAALSRAGDTGRRVLEEVRKAMFGDGDVENASEQVNAWTEQVQSLMAADAEPPVPRPDLEDTRLRDAAHHLLWYAAELSLDRVPLTNDML